MKWLANRCGTRLARAERKILQPNGRPKQANLLGTPEKISTAVALANKFAWLSNWYIKLDTCCKVSSSVDGS